MNSNKDIKSEKLKLLFLIVDDELYIVETLKDLFENGYEVLVTTSALEGLDLFNKCRPDLILADQRMPEITGVELMEKIRKIDPDTIRMIITGYSDIQAVFDAINRGEVFRYITKPWKNEELKLIIKEGAERCKLNKENKRLNEKFKSQRGELEEKIVNLERINKELDSRLREMEERLRGKGQNLG